jgi:cold shock CspA family protein
MARSQALNAAGISNDVYVHYTNIDPTKKNVFKKLAEHEKVEFFIGQGYGNDNRKQAKNVISKGMQAASSGQKEGHGKGRQVSHGVRTLAYEGSGEEDVDLKAAVKTLAKQGVLNRKALHMTRKLLGSLIAITGAQEYVVALIKKAESERTGEICELASNVIGQIAELRGGLQDRYLAVRNHDHI